MTIRNRLLIIAGLAALSIYALFPRDVTRRVIDPATGRMKDTAVRQVPIQLGLDLSGGIHLALEVDANKAPVADCADAIRRGRQPSFYTVQIKD